MVTTLPLVQVCPGLLLKLRFWLFFGSLNICSCQLRLVSRLTEQERETGAALKIFLSCSRGSFFSGRVWLVFPFLRTPGNIQRRDEPTGQLCLTAVFSVPVLEDNLLTNLGAARI